MELIETKGVLETHAWMKMKWSDSKLSWKPAEHDNISVVHAAADEVSFFGVGGGNFDENLEEKKI